MDEACPGKRYNTSKKRYLKNEVSGGSPCDNHMHRFPIKLLLRFRLEARVITLPSNARDDITLFDSSILLNLFRNFRAGMIIFIIFQILGLLEELEVARLRQLLQKVRFLPMLIPSRTCFRALEG